MSAKLMLGHLSIVLLLFASPESTRFYYSIRFLQSLEIAFADEGQNKAVVER